ncbi:MAG: gliding motility-associated ABC transporter substrate-binding protein GldG [Bacteroidales bacterium]|jgi:ABC-2 type transport system permease protein|nr:gliding motility-associated ABC transporter substrate-binding protein GldG [Bacteroidales bacterium]
MSKDKKVKSTKRESLLRFGSIVLIIIAINIISLFLFLRLDLTVEKRYTLSKSTKEMLANLDDVIYVKIYLYGKGLPPDYAELSSKTRELLDELRVYSDNIEYEFIDPAKGREPQELNAIYGELYKKGLNPQSIQTMEADGVNTRYIVPGALISYRQQDIPVQLLDSDDGILFNSGDIIKYSIEKLEYNVTNAIRRITNLQRSKVAFIKGHGELTNIEVFKAAMAIAQFYAVDSVILDNRLSHIFDVEWTDSTGNFTIKGNKYDLLIIAKPTQAFGRYEKYILDQFVMRGGRLLWYVDPVLAEMDSLFNYAEMPVLPRDLNLDDMFFRYGVRMKTNLLQDLNALPIPVGSGTAASGQPQYVFIPWYYFPIITPFIDHPIVKNLNVLRTEFISSIDTIGTQSAVKRTVLLTTSATTKVVNTPSIISLESLKRRANMREYNKKYMPVSILAEGEFSSLFADFEGNDEAEELGLIKKSVPTKMIFVSDGDMIKNQLGPNSVPFPLGFDKYTETAYGNKNFLLNAVNYLCDDVDILQVRSKDFKMRLLDKNKILKEKSAWQIFNLILPLVCIGILGVVFAFIRKLKYQK